MIQQNAAPTFYYSKHMTLEGKREQISFSYDKISQATDGVMNMLKDSSLSKLEQAECRTILEAEITRGVQAKIKANQIMNKTSDAIYVKEKSTMMYGGDFEEANQLFSRSIYIFEKNEKQYENDDLDTWKPRIEMLEQAFACRAIFAISIVPFDPDIQQTWYHKKSISQIVVVPENDQRMNSILGYVPSYDEPFESSGIEIRTIGSSCKEQNNPSEILPGFFLPYSTFSSDIAKAQIDPENLPNSVARAYVFSEKEINNIFLEVKDADIRERIKEIVFSFIDDEHAKGLGLTILQAPLNKFYFTKIK